MRGQVLQPRFDDIALIDFAFSLVSGERLDSALPIAQQADYEYQSPRLLSALAAGRHGDLAPTRQLDWRCDLFSLAAMLWRYLPELEDTTTGAWTRPRHARARALVRRLIEAHDAEVPVKRPHAALIALASEPLAQAELIDSLQRGWTLAFDTRIAEAASPTPVTRIALPVPSPATSPGVTAVAPAPAATATPTTRPVNLSVPPVPVAGVPTSRPAARATGPLSSATTASATESATEARTATATPPPTTPALANRPDAANETLAVDPTDVAMRMQAHRRGREQRTRRLATASALTAAVIAATAAAAWLEPTWRPLLGAAHVQLPATATAPSPAARRDEPIVATAPAETLGARRRRATGRAAAGRCDTAASGGARPGAGARGGTRDRREDGADA